MVHIAEPVLHLLKRRHRFELDVRASPLDLEQQGFTSASADNLLHVRKAVDRTSVDAEHQVARLEARSLGRASGLDCIYPRRGARLAENHEETRENRNRKHEIRQGPGAHNGCSSPYRLVDEALTTLLLRHARYRCQIGGARRVFIPEELYVSAQWNGGDFPPRAVAVIETEQFRAEANGKDQDFDAAPARDKEMAKLVEKHHGREHEQKGNHNAQHA